MTEVSMIDEMQKNPSHGQTDGPEKQDDRLTEQDLRLHCLGMANNGSDAPAKVVERAEAYLKFLKAESNAEEEAE